MMICLWVLALVLTSGAALADDSRLEFVSIIFRHGDRTPIDTYPNDPHQEDAWPQGWGHLTLEGMRQEYHLGSLFKERYIDSGYMSSNYSLSQLYVRSTDHDRTLMSAECVLAGLYPPNTNQEFRPGLQWQPIPVHTVPKNDDNLLNEATCPVYEELLAKDRDIWKKQEDACKDLFNSLTNLTGETVNINNVGHLKDTLFVEYTHNLSMPSWFSLELLDKLEMIDNFLLYLQTNTDEKRKLTGGVWVNQVLGDMERKVNGTLDDMKLVLYSAHDSTVAAMLSVFGLFNGKQPPYSSAFIVELYSHNSNYYVKFYYRNDTWSDDFIQLVNSQCTKSIDQSCSLSELQHLMEQYRLTPTQWYEVCQVNTPSPSPTSAPHSLLKYYLIIAGAVLLGMTVLILLIGLTVIVGLKCCRTRRKGVYVNLENEESD